MLTNLLTVPIQEAKKSRKMELERERSAESYQQMRRKVKEMKRRRAEESADGLSPAVARYQQTAAGLAMETSKVESVVLAIQEAKKSRKMELERERSAGSYQQMRRKVKEMKRRRAEESADGLSPAVARYQQQSQDTSWKHMFKTSWTTRRKQQQHPVESLYEPAVAMNTVASFSGSSRELQCYCISSRLGFPDARKEEVAKLS
ncbi:hypothetical protein F511_34985 [Dorcoceras hygrometricum]|uniref:Uncharacterized protein n=1 Tax=Dorcoceras hygrometricum TaxID=472368 RepID=A0A2Z7CGQ9_9LAMI|nr:hypothetical protein F511_34985 [Dorcoceras hygrometricum]